MARRPSSDLVIVLFEELPSEVRSRLDQSGLRFFAEAARLSYSSILRFKNGQPIRSSTANKVFSAIERRYGLKLDDRDQYITKIDPSRPWPK
ncbi:hypothetical protein ACFYE9_11105 [Rhizobium leguminosarum]|uniref:Uncharacterized protein n=2 Tax=Rhizobium leguminosarum TaxID=384 RepID=A0A154IEA4_RHILE|nr:hypothetical protein [Rhizobium leguminosarum]KZA98862.1 hypothetical protein A4A59_25235 [Rhizobium leguminosarum]